MKTMETTLRYFRTGFDKVLTGSGYFAALLVILSACFVTFDIVMRGVWNSPTNWVFEYSLYMIAAGAYLSIAYVLRENGHINIDILTSRLSSGTNLLVKFVTLIWSSAICIALTYSATQLLQRSIVVKAVSNTTLETPLWIPQLPLVIGLVLLSIQAIRMTVQQGTLLGHKQATEEDALGRSRSSGILGKPYLFLAILIILLAAETVMIAGSGTVQIAGVILFLLTVLATGTPIFLTMALTGGIAFYFILGGGFSALAQLAPLGHQNLMSTAFTAIPLFIFGAGIFAVGGFTDKLFNFFRVWLPAIRGKLAIVTILACGLFAACSGSSVATAAAFAVVAVPLMLANNYDKRLAYGTVAAGGTLGPMIPPSIGPILFGQLTGLSVGALLMAGLMPGVLMIVVFSIYIIFRCWNNKRYDSEVASTKIPWKDRLQSIVSAGPAFGAPIIVIGGIYSGFATPTEAASLLVVYALIVALIMKGKDLKSFKPALNRSVITSTMVYAITFSAATFSAALSFLKVPQTLATLIGSFDIPPITVIIAIMILLLILGMFMDPIAIILITVPILYPIVAKLGFNGIWFCTLFNLNIEIGMLTPPVGMNLYVLQGATKDKFGEVMRGAIPFIICLIICIIILLFIPEIATWLPSLMGF